MPTFLVTPEVILQENLAGETDYLYRIDEENHLVDLWLPKNTHMLHATLRIGTDDAWEQYQLRQGLKNATRVVELEREFPKPLPDPIVRPVPQDIIPEREPEE